MHFHSVLIASAVAVAALLPAQQTPNPQDPNQRPPNSTQQRPEGEHRMDAQRGDGLLAAWLLIDNENEIALARLAQERAQSPEVKQFAQKMVDDHAQMGQKLQPIAARVGYTAMPDGRGGERREGDDRRGEGREGGRTDGGKTDTGRENPPTGTPPTGTPPRSGTEPQDPTRTPRDQGDRAGAPTSGGEQLGLALLQELGMQCRESARKELEQKSGADFDRCFMGMAIGGHMKANDMMTVFSRRSSGDLKTALTDGQRTVKSHLEQAKEIAKRLDRDGDTKRGG